MSRIGNKPIILPKGVQVSVEAERVTVGGPLGQLSKPLPPGIAVQVEGGTVQVSRSSDSAPVKALHGLVRSVLANMVQGVTVGFKEIILLEGVGYRAQVQGNQVQLSVGYSHPVILQPPEGVRIEAETPSRLVISGIDKESVGQFAANMKAVRPMSHYGYKDGRGKGIRLARETPRFKQRKVGA